MRYHIFHTDSMLSYHDWDVDEGVVKTMAKAYLRGQTSAIVGGEKRAIGQRNFQIYENPKLEGVAGVLEESLKKLDATKSYHSLDHFEKKYKNVTEKFLLGMTWGELSEDYFNVAINDGESKPVILAVTKSEIDSFLAAWAQGKSPIWIAGRRVDLNDPKSIKIFDIEFEWLAKDRGTIVFNIKKYAKLNHKGVYKVEVLEHFGKDVTSNWQVRPFGQTKSSGFNWDIIHPEITRVCKTRFTSPNYADAVEAALKELNDVIKTEYTKFEKFEKDGDRLMKQVFSPENPKFKLADLTTESGRNIQQGYMEIFAGAIKGIRNPKAHKNLVIDAVDAWEKIVLASHLMKMWDKRIKDV